MPNNEYVYTNNAAALKDSIISRLDVNEINTNLRAQRTARGLTLPTQDVNIPPHSTNIFKVIEDYEKILYMTAADLVSYGGNSPLAKNSQITDFTTGNITVSGTGTSPRTFTKTAGATNTWDAQVYSLTGFTDGRVEFTAPTNCGSVHIMIGLTTDPAASASYDTIDFAMYISAGTLYKYTNGTGTALNTIVSPGDRLAVQKMSGEISYWKNGVRLSTDSSTPGAVVYLDSSFYELNSAVSGVCYYPFKFSSALTVGDVILGSHWDIVKQVANDSANGERCTGCSVACTRSCSLSCYSSCTSTCADNCNTATCGAACSVYCTGDCAGGNCGSSCSSKSCRSSCAIDGGCGSACSATLMWFCASTCKSNCANGCHGDCDTGCLGCSATCGSGCTTSSCGAICSTVACGTNCTTNCYSTCSGNCNTNCNNSCSGSCYSGCSGNCSTACTGGQRSSSLSSPATL